MTERESDVLAAAQIAASRAGWRLLRNQVGKYKLADGRWLTSGLCVGSSDLIGWRPITITHDMVGSTIAQFVAVECKSKKGSVSPEQENFIAAVNRAGGHAFISRDGILFDKQAD